MLAVAGPRLVPGMRIRAHFASLGEVCLHGLSPEQGSDLSKKASKTESEVDRPEAQFGTGADLSRVLVNL